MWFYYNNQDPPLSNGMNGQLNIGTMGGPLEGAETWKPLYPVANPTSLSLRLGNETKPVHIAAGLFIVF